MSKRYGIFTNPSPTSLSDLINDGKYMAIREYTLDSSVLTDNTSVYINDISAGSTITKISLNVISPFKSSDNTNTIEVITDSNKILMDKTWNNPEKSNNYETTCFYVTGGNTNELIINHTLNDITSGSAILRIEFYEDPENYTEIITSDNKTYITIDNKTIDVSE